MICFLNIVIFPAGFYGIKSTKSAIQTTFSVFSNSLLEYIMEDCLGIADPTPDDVEGNVGCMEETLEDIDLLHQPILHISLFSFNIEIKEYFVEDFRLSCSYVSSSTPPPEYYL